MKRIDRHVALMLVTALAVRLLIWWVLPYRDWISDEGEYWGAATWLASGKGFQFFDQWVWLRPPLYVLFLAGHIGLFGPTALWAPRLTQAFLGVIAVWLLLRIAARLAPKGHERKVALISGWGLTLSYSFASFTYFLLSETVFLCLFLALVLALLRWSDSFQRWWLVVAAVLLASCMLTRAVIFNWLPLLGFWVFWMRYQATKLWPQGVFAVGAMMLVVFALTLPWTLFASQRWGGDGLILVDTTGGYNWALGVQSGIPGGRDEKFLHDLLCGGPQCDGQHAKRQAAAYAQGFEWLRDYPLGYVAKSGREFFDMLQLRYGGAERLVSGYTVGVVPLPHLLGLLLDDTLYAVAVGLALLGLFRRQERTGKGLIIGWLVYNVAIGALVFAINRFRHPLMPFVFIYAACAVAQWREPWPTLKRQRLAWALAGLLWLIVLPSYLYWPFGDSRRSIWQDTLEGVEGLVDAADCRRVETAFRAGDLVAARNLHDEIDRDKDLSCLALWNARILQHEGRVDAALALLHTAAPVNAEQASKILMTEGDMLRQLGRLDAARDVFTPRTVEIINDTAWAWEHLEPPPTTRIDLGNGLDYGYIRDFYTRESGSPDFRWSGANPVLRFPNAGSGQPQTLVLRVNGYTTNPQPTVITPSVAGVALAPITLTPDWQDISIALPPTPAGATVEIAFSTPVFVPGPQDLALRVRDSVRQPLRLLGFQLDWAELR